MNISSIIVLINDENVIQQIQNLKKCEIYARDEKKIVVVIDAKNLDETIKIFKQIQSIKGVENVDMIYSYDDENYENFKNCVEILNSEDKISYKGDVKNLLDNIK